MFENRNLASDLLALGLLAVTAFMAVSLGSYHPADQPPPHAKPPKPEPLTIELFHLDADPYEKTNMAEQEPERVKRLLAKLREFRALRSEGGVPPMTAPPPEGWKAPEEWRMAED